MGVLETMNLEDIRSDLEALATVSKNIVETTLAAKRNRKNLSGNNFYARKFHEFLKEIAGPRTRLSKALEAIAEDGELSAFSELCERIQSTELVGKPKTEALREIELAWHTKYLNRIENMAADPIPVTEQVLPMALVEDTRRGYLIKVVRQANGCYEHGWYDACAVMIRRLVETIIIQIYEHTGNPGALKDGSGNYRMLSHLIDVISADPAFHLGRETKAVLPLLKSLGDRSAHNRTYNATKPDIDKVLAGLRVLAEEFLHLGGLK